MTSTRTKNQARAIQRANPGMKYTEALRLAERKPLNIDPISDPTSITKALDAAGIEHTIINLHPGQTGTLDPFALADRHEATVPRSLERSTPPGVVHLESKSVESVVAEALRSKAERLAAGTEGDEAPAPLQIDEYYSMAPSAESTARFNELLRMGRSVPKQRRLQFQAPGQMADLLQRPSVGPHAKGEVFFGRTSGSAEPVWLKTPEARFPTVDAGNILVWGDTGTGRTTALRALVSHALGKGWRVSVADVKDDGYADFLDSSVGRGRVVTSRGYGSLDQGSWLRFAKEGEGEAMDFIASLEPGTAQDPHLVVIDEGQGLLVSRNQSYEGGQWMKNLHRLLADPHTVVAFQAGAGGGLPSDDFISLFDSRLMYGRHDAETWELGFRDIAPESAFQAFAFNASPKSSDLIHGHSRGIFWNGERLGHVAPEDTLPQAKV